MSRKPLREAATDATAPCQAIIEWGIDTLILNILVNTYFDYVGRVTE